MTFGRTMVSIPGRRALLAVWVSAAVVSGGLLFAAGRLEGPLDDPDQAKQRVGFLDEGPLPIAAADVTGGLPAVGRATVVVFLRPDEAGKECRELSDRLGSAATVVVVVSGPASCPGIRASKVDPESRTAALYGMRVPDDGGPPVGYAIVDAEKRVRYRTLDPVPAGHTGEIKTILRAL